MYKDVARKAYTPSDLEDTFRSSDLPRFEISREAFDLVAKSAAENFATQPGYIGKLVVSPRPKKKNLFTLPNLEDHLLVRRSCAILGRFLGLQTFSRDSEVRQLISIVATEPKAKILRTDIKSFFESVNLERVIGNLQSAGFNNQSTIRHLLSFARKGREHKSLGLPRGISLSSLLADFAMREFDQKVRLLPTCCYYCRYVDDILVVVTDDKVQVFNEMQKFLPVGLRLNPGKTEDRCVGDPEWIEFLGYSICLDDHKRVRIASSKIAKSKKRITLAIKSFISNQNFELLHSRIQFLSTNTIMSMYSREKPIVVGYRYSYSLALETEVTSQMTLLDSFYSGLVNSRRFYISKKLQALLGPDQKRALSKLSFLQGYKLRITFARTAAEIFQLKEAWRHA